MPRKLTEADLKKFEELLLVLRREVAGDINHLEADAFSTDGERATGDNLADVGSDSFAQEFSLELLERDGETLERIEEALKRVEDGTFGRCGVCNSWIGKERLKAMPYAKNCISCQREAELEA